MKILKLFPFFLVLIVLPFTSHAWGTTGHRVVGQVADAYLTPNARKAIKGILGNESVAMVANWADFIKSDTTLKDLDPWHYVNLPDSMSRADVQQFLSNDTAVNVYNKTMWLIKELKNKKLPKDKQAFYLKLLIHFIGDIHQPMHTARATDRGGNSVKVGWFNESSNLHTIWDTKLIDMQQLSYTEYASWINHPSAADKTKWQKQPVSEWVWESYQISRAIYQKTPADSRQSYRYNYEWISTINQQLLKGGVRLAGVLNDIFK